MKLKFSFLAVLLALRVENGKWKWKSIKYVNYASAHANSKSFGGSVGNL